MSVSVYQSQSFREKALETIWSLEQVEFLKQGLSSQTSEHWVQIMSAINETFQNVHRSLTLNWYLCRRAIISILTKSPQFFNSIQWFSVWEGKPNMYHSIIVASSFCMKSLHWHSKIYRKAHLSCQLSKRCSTLLIIFSSSSPLCWFFQQHLPRCLLEMRLTSLTPNRSRTARKM